MDQKGSTNEGEKWVENIANTLQKDYLGIQVGLYGAGFVGLFVALRRVRPFQKFTRPQSIPRRFISKQTPLTGVVKSAELGAKGGAVLRVAHRPLVTLGRGEGPPHLPLTLAGVSPTTHGLSWLQIMLDKQPVMFTVISTNQQAASAVVSHQGTDISMRLVELGFAQVLPYDSQLKNNAAYMKLHSQLLRCQRRAERNGRGMWWKEIPLHIRLANKIASNLRLLAVRLAQLLPHRQQNTLIVVR